MIYCPMYTKNGKTLYIEEGHERDIEKLREQYVKRGGRILQRR